LPHDVSSWQHPDGIVGVPEYPFSGEARKKNQ